eukprot:CAMPEP_0171095648 /NCGR_PEP_ID=MMETSP0766_2-20121228/43289_1 /TAXON_ID=439317 /ORGANISM="Gambierdiscus australes, Strain CAWD 149" /LENGTH=58 /DNA_ID=CAMNT_0011554479 /DNA_START=695 /DNA_END=867 /DNA_ORIENTATION=-
MHRIHQGFMTRLPLDCGVAAGGHGVRHEELPEGVRRVDLLGHITQVAKVVQRAGPRVP